MATTARSHVCTVYSAEKVRNMDSRALDAMLAGGPVTWAVILGEPTPELGPDDIAVPFNGMTVLPDGRTVCWTHNAHCAFLGQGAVLTLHVQGAIPFPIGLTDTLVKFASDVQVDQALIREIFPTS